MTEMLLLVVVVVTALAFDFTNGFHDTGNAMASSIATGALKPKQAVALSAVLNLVGAFVSLTVAATIAKGLVDANVITLEVVFAGLVGGITWNLLTWLLGIPSSSSHALVGGVVGSVLAAVGSSGVIWSGVISKVVLPALFAPIVAIGVAATGTWLVARITKAMPLESTNRRFRWGQIGSASLISLAHGTNDAQKSMGIILLALIAGGAVPASAGVPIWVVVACASAMAAGTYLGGWRVIRTLGKGLTKIDPRQGMAADMASASVILLSSHFGYSLSTTQVATGSIMGSGVGMPGAKVRWGVAGRMLIAWGITLPCAGVVGACCTWIQHGVGGWLGTVLVLALLIATATAIFIASRRKPVHAENVNDDWDGDARVQTPEQAATNLGEALGLPARELSAGRLAGPPTGETPALTLDEDDAANLAEDVEASDGAGALVDGGGSVDGGALVEASGGVSVDDSVPDDVSSLTGAVTDLSSVTGAAQGSGPGIVPTTGASTDHREEIPA